MDLSNLDDAFYDEFVYNIPPTETQKKLEEEIVMYMRANERWQKKSYKNASIECRRHLRNIIKLANLRKREILAIRDRIG